MLFDEPTTILKLAAVQQKQSETPGSIISGASQTVYREHLPSGHFTWAYKPVNGAWNRNLAVQVSQ